MIFKAGDVVELKSGSDQMTIEEIDRDYAVCVWQGSDDKINRDTFKLILLEKID